MKTPFYLRPQCLGLALAWFVIPGARAQTSPPVPVAVPAMTAMPMVGASPRRSLSPEEIRALVEQRRAARATNNPAGEESAAPPKTFAEAVSRMKFDRTPEALLEVVKSQQSGAPPTEAERFRFAVLLGDWVSVSNALQILPPGEAKEAYARLLAALAGNSQSAAQFYQQSAAAPSSSMAMDAGDGGDPQTPANRSARKSASLLLEQDFYALVAAAPGDLDPANLPQLSALVKIAVGSAGKNEFLARLSHGLKGFGGSASSGRQLAAQLLSSLDWIADAGPYLPLKREEWEQADTLSLVLAMEYFTQTGIQQRDERQLKGAAELCAFMMQTSRFGADDKGLFRQATDRFVKLLPALEAAEAEQLIRENFLTQPLILNDLILVLGESGQQALRGTDLNLRGQSLATQSILMRVLAGRKSALPASANVLVMNWLNEAETTYRSGKPDAADQEDALDNPFVFRSSSYYYNRQRNQAKVLKAEVILANAPTPALIRRLNEGLSQRVNLTLLKANLLDPKEPETLATLAAYLKDHPGQEKELCQDYLGAWVKKRSVPPEDPNIIRMRNLGYQISRQQPAGGGIPLTRLRQNKNVADYKNLLTALRPLSPEPLAPASVVQGFMAIHSGAEVYRAEDIAAIFGPAEKMSRAELMQLVTGMRTKLHEQWQDPKVQQDAGANRTEQEAKDEVSRGYRTAIALVKKGLTEKDAEWQQYIVRGQLFFDASEFEFARQVKLTEYVSLRDEAFASYRQAAQIYAAKVPYLARGQWTLEPYQMWFIVMLGASDLSQLTRSAARSDPGLSQIGDAMRALPGAAAAGHLQKFGEMLGSLLSQVPGNLRQNFLSAGLQVVGANHPSAKVAQASLKNYQELLDEVLLRATVDGPARVGHAQPFGLALTLEHTRQIAREGGGFAKYLQNAPVQRQVGLQAAGNPAANYRDNFARNIHGALDETFEIISITFASPEVHALDLPREGWQATPLAYLVLRAKEAAVDRIPSVQLDMDFSDTSGQVVLPVRSQLESIDAREADSAPRPCPGLALTLTMDEREWVRDGRVVVEVSAKGRGVIPAHGQLFDFAQAGFDCEVTDNGVSVAEFSADGKVAQAQADRNWQFTYQRRKDLRGDAVLKFPVLKSGIFAASVEYQHYQDADLIKLDANQAVAGVVLKSTVNRGLRNAFIVFVLGGITLGAWLRLRARSGLTQASANALEMPAQITPFSVVAFLRRLQREASGRLDEPAKQALKGQIEELELAFFRGGQAPSNPPDLAAVAQKWWQLVR